MSKILVSGCAGFIGSHVTETLLERGDEVVGVDDFNDYYDPLIKRKNAVPLMRNRAFKLYELDVQKSQGLNEIFESEKIDKIIHLAARAGVGPSISNPELYFDVNVWGTKNFLDLAVRHGVENFAFASSSSVYGVNEKVPFSEEDEVVSQISPYARTKRIGEQMCSTYNRQFGLKGSCLRFFTVYGPRGRPDMAPYKFTKLISEGKEIEMFGDGTTSRDYTFIDDIVEGIVSSVDNHFDFEIINLGNGRPVNLKRFIDLISSNVGKDARVIQKPMPSWDVPITFADISKARKLLGYEPKISVEEGVRRMVGWYEKENSNPY